MDGMRVNHEIYEVKTPVDIVALIPADLQYVYERTTNGADVLGVAFDTAELGSFVMWLSTPMARHVTSHLLAMLDDLAQLRAEYDD